MTTLVTGAGGFVGRALVRRMAATGYPARVRLTDLAAGDAPPGDFEWMAGDLADPDFARALLDGVDRVINLAALPGGAAGRDPAGSRRVNLDAPLALIEAAARPLRLVHASSIAVLGAPSAPGVDDDTPPAPL